MSESRDIKKKKINDMPRPDFDPVIDLSNVEGLPCNNELCKDLVASFNYHTETYFSQKTYLKNEPSPPEVRKTLEILHNRALALAQALSQLDFKTQTEYLALPYSLLEETRKNAETIAFSAEKAYKDVPVRKSGKNSPLVNYIYQLGLIYKKATGNDPGMSSVGSEGYDTGPFHRFVKSCLEYIKEWPDIFEVKDREEPDPNPALRRVIEKTLNLAKERRSF